MKTSSFFGMLLLAAAISLSFSSCSSDDNPATDEEPSFMEGKMPTNLHVGMLYPISHDKVNDECIFGIYLGENPSQEMIDALEQGTVNIAMYDRHGNRMDGNSDVYDWKTDTYKSGFNTWDKEKRRYEFRHDNTINLPCVLCETVPKFEIYFSNATLYNFYPELADMSDVKLHIATWPVAGEVSGITITQSWSSPHHYYY